MKIAIFCSVGWVLRRFGILAGLRIEDYIYAYNELVIVLYPAGVAPDGMKTFARE